MKKPLSINELGRRIGESHPGAKLTDAEVELVHELLEGGMSFAKVAEKFNVSKSCIQKIADGSRRAQRVSRTVWVSVRT